MSSTRAWVWLLVGAIGCSGGDGDGGDAGAADAGAAPDAAAVDSGFADASTPDSGADDGNDGFDQAVDSGKNTSLGVPGAIEWPGDRDYFRFEGEAGEFVAIFTNSSPGLSGRQVDPVIRLYDAQQTQVAENDDALPRFDVDSEIIYRLPNTGTYYVEVLEWSDWAEEAPIGDPELRYRLLVRTVNDVNPGVTVEIEAGNDAASAIPLDVPQTAGLAVGGFDDASDVDVYALTVTRPGRFGFLLAMPPGVEGYGSTSPLGEVWVTTSSGTEVVARKTLSAEVLDVSPALPPGDYQLWLAHPGTPGANDFYVFKFFLLEEADEEIEPNDTRELAYPLTLISREQQMDRAAFVLAHLGEGDTDYFQLTVASNEAVTVFCTAETDGSGVRGLTVDLLDDGGNPITSVMETSTEFAAIDRQSVDTPTVYVRLTKTGQAMDVTSQFVRCGFAATIE